MPTTSPFDRSDHYIARWVLRGFIDTTERRYYSLAKGAMEPRQENLDQMGARLGGNVSVAPGGTEVDTEEFWSDWDGPAGTIRVRVQRQRCDEEALVGLVPFAAVQPLRVPSWRDAATAAAGIHQSNAGSVLIAAGTLGVQGQEAVTRGLVNVTAWTSSGEGDERFLTSDAGTAFEERHGEGHKLITPFALPWDVESFEPDATDPDFASPPRPLRLTFPIARDLCVEIKFVAKEDGGYFLKDVADASTVHDVNTRMLAAAHRYAYGARDQLTDLVGQF